MLAVHNWFLNINADLLFILIVVNLVGVDPFALTSQINFEYTLSSMEHYLYPLPYQKNIDKKLWNVIYVESRNALTQWGEMTNYTSLQQLVDAMVTF